MIKYALILGVTTTLFGCAAAPPPGPHPNALELMLNSPPASAPASKAETDAAAQASNYCMWKAAADLDDGVSPANVIAQAVVNQCTAQLNREASLDVQGLNTEEAAASVQGINGVWVGIATNIVLRYRVSKKQANATVQ